MWRAAEQVPCWVAVLNAALWLPTSTALDGWLPHQAQVTSRHELLSHSSNPDHDGIEAEHEPVGGNVEHHDEDHGRGHNHSHGHGDESHNHKYDVKKGAGSIHGHGEEMHISQDAHSVAVGLVATVIIVPLVVSMALGGGMVHVLTMRMLDTFTSIFLAVLWFNTFRQILETLNVANLFPYAREVFSFLQILLLYSVANLVAWLWRDDNMRLTTFCSCGAHFIAFAGVHFAGQTQSAAAHFAGDTMGELSVCGLCVATGVFLGMMFSVNFLIWRSRATDEKMDNLHTAIDELEMDVMGLVLSFVITQALRHVLTGEYPHLHVGIVHKMSSHTFWQRWFMLFWSVSLTILAWLVLPWLSRKAVRRKDSKLIQNLVHMAKVVMVMLIAWGFLLWGEWEFYENLFRGDPMFGHMLFAVTATLACLAVLFLLASLRVNGGHTIEDRQTCSITTTGVSLVAAWSWEHCFNMAFDIIGHEYQVGYGGLMPKLMLSVVVPAVLLPTYVRYVRKEVMEIDADEERAEKEEIEKEAEEQRLRETAGSTPVATFSGGQRRTFPAS